MARLNNRMAVVLLAATVLAVLGVGAALLLPGDEELRDMAVAALAKRFGIPVTIASVHWQLLPVPAVVVRDARMAEGQPITVRHVSAVLNVGRTVLRRAISLDSIELDGAVVPTVALPAFRGKPGPALDGPGSIPVEHVRFRDVTWLSQTGIPLPIEGEIDFDAHWRPRYAQVRRAGPVSAARLTLLREGQAESWEARVVLGSGTADGRLGLTVGDDGTLVLGGALEPRGIDVASAVGSLNRRSPVGGTANGHTRVSATGRTAGELGQSLRLLTDFRMAPATVLRVDVDKAVRTLGISHDGKTELKLLTGVMDLRNTGKGTVLGFTGVEAEGSSFTATGEGTIFNGQVNAHGTLHLAHGAVGVPFTIRGATRKPKLTVFGRPTKAVPGPAPTPADAAESPAPAAESPPGVRDER